MVAACLEHNWAHAAVIAGLMLGTESGSHVSDGKAGMTLPLLDIRTFRGHSSMPWVNAAWLSGTCSSMSECLR